jgi:hypothetical protein
MLCATTTAPPSRLAQLDQRLDPHLQQAENPLESRVDFFRRARGFGRVGRAPLQFFGRAHVGRAALGRRVVADGDDEVEGLAGKCVPGFAARGAGIDPMTAQDVERPGVDLPHGLASGAHGPEFAFAQPVEQGLGHDRPAGISRTQDQYFFCHVSSSVPAVIRQG